MQYRTYLTFLFFLFFHLCNCQNQLPWLSKFDIEHYCFELELSDESNHIKGKATLKVRLLDDLEALQIDLVSKGQGEKGMEVQSVQNESGTLDFNHNGDNLTIFLKENNQRGVSQNITITYEGIPKDGLVISQNKYGDRTFFGDNWPNRARHWLPCLDHPSEKATVEFMVTAPDHYQVVANGNQVEETNISKTQKLTHWKTDVPLPMKVVVIGVARFAVHLDGYANQVPISSWVFPQDRKAGFHDYSMATYVLDYFIHKIGPYPYEKLANVQSKTRYGGMENAGNIFYYENSVTGKRTIENLIAHEIAHQWFGNSASELSWHHIWLSEGFATYLTDLFVEHRYGRDAFVQKMIAERNRVVLYAQELLRPVIDTTVTDYNKLLNPNSYQKGGWVLHMLRNKIGDAYFWEGIRTYYQKYKLSNALTEDFQRVMEEVSGQNLSDFFQQWLYQAGHPKLALNHQYDKEQQTLSIEIKQLQEPLFTFDLEVEIELANGDTFLESIPIDKAATQTELMLKQVPLRITLDPKVKLLFEQVKN